MHADEVEHPLYGRMPLPRSPLCFSDSPLAPIEPSGETGCDNDAVYGDWLGLDATEVTRLRKDNVI